MKVLISPTSLAGTHDAVAGLARAVLSLFRDDHSVVLVHGDRRAKTKTDKAILQNGAFLRAAPSMMETAMENRNLVATLNRAGIPALGISGADGGMCDVRKKRRAESQYAVELASMNCRWLETICIHRGVPVISNVVLAPWGEHCLVDPDELAAACAIAWNADALIFLSGHQGVMDSQGAVIRWLEATQHPDVSGSSNPADVVSKVKACSEALKKGVKRTRILPASEVERLSLFYLSRIESGTEVVLTQAKAVPA